MILDARLFLFLRRTSFSFSPLWLFCEKLWFLSSSAVKKRARDELKLN